MRVPSERCMDNVCAHVSTHKVCAHVRTHNVCARAWTPLRHSIDILACGCSCYSPQVTPHTVHCSARALCLSLRGRCFGLATPAHSVPVYLPRTVAFVSVWAVRRKGRGKTLNVKEGEARAVRLSAGEKALYSTCLGAQCAYPTMISSLLSSNSSSRRPLVSPVCAGRGRHYFTHAVS